MNVKLLCLAEICCTETLIFRAGSICLTWIFFNFYFVFPFCLTPAIYCEREWQRRTPVNWTTVLLCVWLACPKRSHDVGRKYLEVARISRAVSRTWVSGMSQSNVAKPYLDLIFEIKSQKDISYSRSHAWRNISKEQLKAVSESNILK